MKTIKLFTVNGMTYEMVQEQNKIVYQRNYMLQDDSETVEPITPRQLASETDERPSHGAQN